jgi:transposase InsO family protein
MRYRFVDTHKKVWPINLMCRVLNVSRSGYYGWLDRPPNERAKANTLLDEQIKRVFRRHERRYGAPRIARDLQDEVIPCSRSRVARRMRSLGLRALQSRKFKVTTDSNHDMPVAKDLINQDFSASAANEKWCGDITYIWTDEGWLYLAVMMDLYSRMIVGWSMQKRMKQDLVCDALSMALFRRQFPKDTIVHSDRGSQYCSNRYQKLIKQHSLRCSMGRRATCYDNAACESFFHTLKVELVYQRRFRTRQEAKTAIFEYMETYYNRLRRHSSIDYATPEMFEDSKRALAG